MSYCPKCGAKLQPNVECDCQSQNQGNSFQSNANYSSYTTSYNDSGVKLIKVTSIILIIFGSLGLLLNLSILSSIDQIADDLKGLIIFEIIIPILTLISGIIGIVSAKDKSKANLLIILGVFLLAVRIVDLVWALSVFETVEASVITGAIFGSALPILYIIGSCLRKKS